jgi:hypothetical protein
VTYVPGDNEKDMLFIGKGYPEDFNISRGWKLVGANYTARSKQK